MSHNIDTTNMMQYNRGVEQIKFRCTSHNINTINMLQYNPSRWGCRTHEITMCVSQYQYNKFNPSRWGCRTHRITMCDSQYQYNKYNPSRWGCRTHKIMMSTAMARSRPSLRVSPSLSSSTESRVDVLVLTWALCWLKELMQKFPLLKSILSKIHRWRPLIWTTSKTWQTILQWKGNIMLN
jgi:hypothetical protein